MRGEAHLRRLAARRGLVPPVGPVPDPGDFEALERLAAGRLDPSVFDYFVGGAGAEQTMRDNRDGWGRWRFLPHVLREVPSVSTATEVLGCAVRTPVLVAPMGYQGLAHPAGESAMAEAAAAAGTLMAVSTYSTTSLEDVAAAAKGAPLWFQTYVLRDRGLTAELLRRAAAAGYRAVVLTVDAPVVGDRRRDRRHGYRLPAEGVRLANFPPERAALALSYSTELETDLGPDVVAWVSETAGLPVVVKGVLRGDDAVTCCEAGARGIVVSNHGGRQLDGALATADALPHVVEAVDGRAEVLVDGGITSGADVVRALALGAGAVLLGRPMLWALAVGGAPSAHATIDVLTAQVERAMRLCGLADVRSVPRDLVVHERGAPPG